MAWGIGSKNIRKLDFPGLRWQLSLYYSSAIAIILGVFAGGVYGFFTRSLYQQLDLKLQTLAQSAAPSLNDVEQQGEDYLAEVNEVPWRDIFNRDQQSLEWFDAEGRLIGKKGEIALILPPKPGSLTIRQQQELDNIRTFTISVYQDGENPESPALRGYIRASQSTESIQTEQEQLLWGLGMGGILAISLAGIGGLGLTKIAFAPVERSFWQLKQFTADASHELRSPLTVIKTSVDVMLCHRERFEEKDWRKLGAIASATTQMTHLVEDLLFLARTDSTSILNQDWHWIALDQMLKDLIAQLEASAMPTAGFAYAHHLTLNVHFTPVFVQGNFSQLTRLFTNLLTNAIKYTPSGGTVTVSLSQEKRHAIVKITDTGIGIPPQQQRLIFERFWRADQARNSQDGTGLGLAIAKAIINYHRGQITVSSTVGVGSSFTVHLPHRQPKAQ
jgi:OmpR-family two-component system manganese-sensing sensor histidine kinase